MEVTCIVQEHNAINCIWHDLDGLPSQVYPRGEFTSGEQISWFTHGLLSQGSLLTVEKHSCKVSPNFPQQFEVSVNNQSLCNRFSA